MQQQQPFTATTNVNLS